MDIRDIEFFLEVPVKLLIQDADDPTKTFALYGTIDRISGDSILFSTKKTTSLIRVDSIVQIVKNKERRGYGENNCTS